jgi:Txe/YoeB family toxin of toxin-antitoxin system
MYKLLFSKQAKKDFEKIKNSPLKKQAAKIFEILETDPYLPPVEKLVGDLEGLFSRRLNIHHRLIYEIDEQNKIIYIYSMWTHYEN